MRVLQANALLHTLQNTQEEEEGETLGDTLRYVEVEELIGTLPEANATKIGDTVNNVESKTLVDTLAETLCDTLS